MRVKLLLLAVLMLAMCVGCEQAAWFAGGAAADAALQAEARKDVIAKLLDDPNMLKIIAEAAGTGVISGQQQEQIAAAIEQYDKTHGAISVIKENAKEPAWWVAFAMSLVAAYQKKQRSKEAKTS